MSNPGFLIITRPLFIDSLNEYVQWKQGRGFDVHIKTADDIDSQFTGAELRFKIRHCIRHYHSTFNVQYVLLIGDSIDITVTEQEPEPVTLSEAWNLPAGYYRMDRMVNGQIRTQTQYSTLFYADLADTVHYNESAYSGNYAIPVGLIPVRTPHALANVLRKTMDSQSTNFLHIIYSEDYYDPAYAGKCYQQIESLGKNRIAMGSHLFGSTSPDNEVYKALCGQGGVIYASGHGLMEPGNPSHTPGFKVGNIWACAADGGKFAYLNPLYIVSSCYADAYQLGECIDEAWLQAPNGPVTMISKPPIIDQLLPEGGLTDSEQGFWKDVLAGKTIGHAFYGNCHGAYGDPLNLFGDPSLVIFKRQFSLSILDWRQFIFLLKYLWRKIFQ